MYDASSWGAPQVPNIMCAYICELCTCDTCLPYEWWKSLRTRYPWPYLPLYKTIDIFTDKKIRQPRWLSGLMRSRVHSLWLLVDHCVLRNWDRILVRAVKGLNSRAGMVSICPLLWQRDVKLQQTTTYKKIPIHVYTQQKSQYIFTHNKSPNTSCGNKHICIWMNSELLMLYFSLAERLQCSRCLSVCLWLCPQSWSCSTHHRFDPIVLKLHIHVGSTWSPHCVKLFSEF